MAPSETACGDFDHVFVAFAEEQVVADADGFGEEADHVGGFADGFAVGDLRFAFVEFLQVQAQERAGAGEAETGAGGLIAEVGDRDAAVEDARADVGGVEGFQRFGGQEGGFEFGFGAFPGEQEVVVVEVGFEAVEFIGELSWLFRCS